MFSWCLLVVAEGFHQLLFEAVPLRVQPRAQEVLRFSRESSAAQLHMKLGATFPGFQFLFLQFGFALTALVLQLRLQLLLAETILVVVKVSQ